MTNRTLTNACTPLSFHCIYIGDRHCGCCRDVRYHHRDARLGKIPSLQLPPSFGLLQHSWRVTINQQLDFATMSLISWNMCMHTTELQVWVCIPTDAGLVTNYHSYSCHYTHMQIAPVLVKRANIMMLRRLSRKDCVYKLLLVNHQTYLYEILRIIHGNITTEGVLKYHIIIIIIIVNRNFCSWCRVEEVCEANVYNFYAFLLKDAVDIAQGISDCSDLSDLSDLSITIEPILTLTMNAAQSKLTLRVSTNIQQTNSEINFISTEGKAASLNAAQNKILINDIFTVTISVIILVIVMLNKLLFHLCYWRDAPRCRRESSSSRTGQTLDVPTPDGTLTNIIYAFITVNTIDCDANSDSINNKMEDSDFKFIFPILNKYIKISHVYLFASIDRIVADKGNVLQAIPELIEEHYVFILLQQCQGETISITRTSGNSFAKLIAAKILKEVNTYHEFCDNKMPVKHIKLRLHLCIKKLNYK